MPIPLGAELAVPPAKPPMWYLEEAIGLVRELQTKALQKGYHLALGGGVLNRGWSRKDLDIVALKMDNQPAALTPGKLVEVLAPYLGEVDQGPGGSVPSENDKLYQFTTSDGRRIDLLFYTRAGQ
jgi:hypothetical protein